MALEECGFSASVLENITHIPPSDCTSSILFLKGLISFKHPEGSDLAWHWKTKHVRLNETIIATRNARDNLISTHMGVWGGGSWQVNCGRFIATDMLILTLSGIRSLWYWGLLLHLFRTPGGKNHKNRKNNDRQFMHRNPRGCKLCLQFIPQAVASQSDSPERRGHRRALKICKKMA